MLVGDGVGFGDGFGFGVGVGVGVGVGFGVVEPPISTVWFGFLNNPSKTSNTAFLPSSKLPV